jgi:hypothetical protein
MGGGFAPPPMGGMGMPPMPPYGMPSMAPYWFGHLPLKLDYLELLVCYWRLIQFFWWLYTSGRN